MDQFSLLPTEIRPPRDFPGATCYHHNYHTFSISCIPPIPCIMLYTPRTKIELARLGFRFGRAKPSPPRDLFIPASYHFNPHIDTNPHTPSATPAARFWWPYNTEHIRSVLASRGSKPPRPPNLCIPASHHLE